MQRRRSGQSTSLKDRLASFAKKLRKQASLLPPGEEKESLLKRAKQADTAWSDVKRWVDSPELQPPR
jgi:hypothetical protein